jgi:hypothetical protein
VPVLLVVREGEPGGFLRFPLCGVAIKSFFHGKNPFIALKYR